MSWESVRMGNFLHNRDLRFKPKDPQIIGLKRIEKIDFSGQIYISEKPSNTDMILIKKGDLVISGINVEKGAMAVYQGEDDITATIHYSSYEYDSQKVDLDFLKNFLRSAKFIQAIKEQVPGGIKTEIKPKHLLPLNVTIPTNVDEQRIVVRELLKKNSRVSSICAENTYQLDLLKKLRQRILQNGVQGKLVSQDPDDESSSRLLEKIKAIKELLISEKKIKKEKLLPKITNEETPFEIPKRWEWCRMGEICGFITKGTTPPLEKIKPYGEIPYLKVYNIIGQKINFDYRPQYIDEDTHKKILTRSMVFPNDVLMNIVGPPLGKVAIVPNTFPQWNINQALVIFRPLVIDISFFLYYYLCEGSEIRKLVPLGVVGQDNLSLEQCRKLIFPLPPLDEQRRIVTKIERLMKLCNELEESIMNNQKYSRELLHVLLTDALQPK
jgi:type I restriction enzyme, S subunit